jgi:hypothetical protein
MGKLASNGGSVLILEIFGTMYLFVVLHLLLLAIKKTFESEENGINMES